MWRRMLAAGVAMLGLAACSGEGAPAAQGGAVPTSVSWNRDPLAVVFRAHVTGGNPPPHTRDNTIPECTVYGDGRVVFPQVNPQSGDNEVIFDVASDDAITGFVYDLMVQFRIYTFDEGVQRQAPASEQPVYEQIVLDVNNTRHVTDFFAEWPGSYFSDVVARCRALATTPRLFRPSGVWLSAHAVPIDITRPFITWDAAAAGFGLGPLAQEGSKRWIEGGLAEFLWDQVIRPSIPVWFLDSEVGYALAVQVPGVTLDAPAAPTQ